MNAWTKKHKLCSKLLIKECINILNKHKQLKTYFTYLNIMIENPKKKPIEKQIDLKITLNHIQNFTSFNYNK